MNEAFLIGGGQIHTIHGKRGETPPCPEAEFKRGDVVKVSRRRGFEHIPAELIVLVAIPRDFSPDFALADLLSKPRPLMHQVGSRSISYILCRDGDLTPYHLKERDLRPSGKESVEVGTVSEQ